MKKVIDSDKNPQFKVFIFKDSDAIQNSITTYLLKKGVQFLVTKSSKKKYFSDLIGESYKNWVNTKIIFDGGTGSGKTYFIINILGVYAKKNKKKMLYLCNRAELKEQIIADAKKAHVDDVMYVTTYQAIQNRLRGGEIIPHYDYVIADECHYFTNDALFNEYTDKSYRYVMTQEQSVVIYISATAKVFFKWLRKRNLVAEDHYFLIPKSYDYVNKVYFYDKKLLIPKVDQILQTEKESKIIIFCNSTTRMKILLPLMQPLIKVGVLLKSITLP